MVENLLSFVYKSPSAYHCVLNSKKMLLENGYLEIFESEKFSLKMEGKYFVTKGDSALIAFEIGSGSLVQDGVRIIGAHTDAPCFKIKTCSEIVADKHFLKLNVEAYGGSILSTWFDRGLGIGGKVVLRGEKINAPIQKLVNINKSVMTIPSLAIHLNKGVNDGYAYNKQIDMLPLMAMVENELEKNDFLLDIIGKESNVKKEDILDFELFLYDTQKGEKIGINEDFFASGRLDDLWMVYTGLVSIINSKKNKATKVMICVDNEEVGSNTAIGAGSSFIKNILERIYFSLGYSKEEFLQGMSNSFAISADLAHSVHPNYGDKHDPTNRPILGKGPVIKYSAGQKYSTNSVGASIFKLVCEEKDIPYQTFANRSDMVGGGTIGPIISSSLAISAVDIGAPILGMHSIRELGAVSDVKHMIDSFTGFYELV